MKKSEHKIQDEIRLAVSKLPGIILRTNAGSVYAGERVWSNYYQEYILKRPRSVRLLPEGFPDLIHLSPDGKLSFIEVKTATGRTSEKQKRFMSLMREYGFRCCVARSAEEAVSFINERSCLDAKN